MNDEEQERGIAMSAPGYVHAGKDRGFSLRSILLPLITIIIGVFMVVLDSTAVNVAVPSLVRDLNDSLATVQWTITGYTLAQAAAIPLAGWLSDRFGAKRLFLTSIALFTLGSVLCATAQSSGMLITFRVLQGLGGGFVLPVGMAYVYRLAPPERVGMVMGLMGIPVLFAPAIGPVVAGWLVQYATWRWIFLLNLPIGFIGVLIGTRGLPVLQRQSVPILDLPGLVFAPLAFVALSYGITQGSSSWTSVNTLGGIAVGVLALLALIAVELRSANPLLELRVFRSVQFCLGIVAQWVTQFALFGALFLIPLFLQEVRGYGAFDTGLTLLPQALSAAVFMPIGGALFDRIGVRPLVLVGAGIEIVASLLLARVDVHTQGSDLVLPLVLFGAGLGLMLMPINTQLINTAPRSLVGKVTALTNATQQVVNSITIAGLTTILTSRPGYHLAMQQVAAIQTRAAQAARAAAAAHHSLPPQGTFTLPTPIAALFSTAFRDTFHLMAAVAVVGALLGFTLRRVYAQQEDEAALDESVPAARMLVG
jgi:EmrB/QacA subfamily drug resistance transporter